MVVVIVLGVFAAVVDLNRGPDSFLLSIATEYLGPRNQMQRLMRRLPRTTR